jgi:hypothetical protein
MKKLLNIISLDIFCNKSSDSLYIDNPPENVQSFVREELELSENTDIQSINLSETEEAAAMKLILIDKK